MPPGNEGVPSRKVEYFVFDAKFIKNYFLKQLDTKGKAKYNAEFQYSQL